MTPQHSIWLFYKQMNGLSAFERMECFITLSFNYCTISKISTLSTVHVYYSIVNHTVWRYKRHLNDRSEWTQRAHNVYFAITTFGFWDERSLNRLCHFSDVCVAGTERESVQFPPSRRSPQDSHHNVFVLVSGNLTHDSRITEPRTASVSELFWWFNVDDLILRVPF